jgi:hypothetical protein
VNPLDAFYVELNAGARLARKRADVRAGNVDRWAHEVEDEPCFAQRQGGGNLCRLVYCHRGPHEWVRVGEAPSPELPPSDSAPSSESCEPSASTAPTRKRE